ncbi:MAG: SpoIID/LytB domain-containing protein, partial [candidate division KSB1 bacterium]|nr:SpoIID/LytB domain-containing protein [candidate division KSB1 bacterium]
KICGGIRESYENVWENIKIPYLQAGIDGDPAQVDYPLDTEEKVRQYIDTSPKVYCNTGIYPLPPKLDFSKNLFRWEMRYTRQQLEQIIRRKTGEDLGELLDIRPVARGHSGRLIFIELVGTKKTLKVGKELEIRRVLSDSHLYSSCFYVDKQLDSRGSVATFVLKGAGWGHGVGLCQVGATTMASQGFSYKEILNHYYKGTDLIKLY